MKKYEIDYGTNVAFFWADIPKAEVVSAFYKYAGQCFGIRKSITQEPRVVSVKHARLPAWARLQGAAVALEHNFPLTDKIVWNADGKKLLNEWGDCELDEEV